MVENRDVVEHPPMVVRGKLLHPVRDGIGPASGGFADTRVSTKG